MEGKDTDTTPSPIIDHSRIKGSIGPILRTIASIPYVAEDEDRDLLFEERYLERGVLIRADEPEVLAAWSEGPSVANGEICAQYYHGRLLCAYYMPERRAFFVLGGPVRELLSCMKEERRAWLWGLLRRFVGVSLIIAHNELARNNPRGIHLAFLRRP